MDIASISTFLKIVSSGSLSKAAKLQNTSTVMISRRLAALEKDLGVRLFHRSTRSLSLTAEGETFLPFAQSLIETTEAAEATLHPKVGATGTLRLTAPVVFGQTVIAPLIPELLASNPELKVDLIFTDSVVDIVSQGIDVAIRIAPLKDSGLIARKLTDNPRIICAAPSYLERHGKPATLAELENHTCLILHGLESWPFVVDGQTTHVKVNGRLATSSVYTIHTACVDGLGIAMMTYWDVKQQLSDGSLVQLEFADGKLSDLAVWAIFPTRQFLPQRVKVFLDELQKILNVSHT